MVTQQKCLNSVKYVMKQIQVVKLESRSLIQVTECIDSDEENTQENNKLLHANIDSH